MTPRLGDRKDRRPDPRHAAIKALLDQHWQRENPSIPSMPWGPGEAGALGAFLRANPALSVDTVALCLLNRMASEDHAPAERVYVWIGDILRYAAGPLNKYRQPKVVVTEPAPTPRGEAVASEPPQEESLAEIVGPRTVENVRRAKASGRHLLDWERRLLRELGEL